MKLFEWRIRRIDQTSLQFLGSPIFNEKEARQAYKEACKELGSTHYQRVELLRKEQLPFTVIEAFDKECDV